MPNLQAVELPRLAVLQQLHLHVWTGAGRCRQARAWAAVSPPPASQHGQGIIIIMMIIMIIIYLDYLDLTGLLLYCDYYHSPYWPFTIGIIIIIPIPIIMTLLSLTVR